jgi:hypothetical protein
MDGVLKGYRGTICQKWNWLIVPSNLGRDLLQFPSCSLNEHAVGIVDNVACYWRKWFDMGFVDTFTLKLIVGFE